MLSPRSGNNSVNYFSKKRIKMNIIYEVIFLVALGAAGVSDWNKRKIPDYITALLLVPGILALMDSCSYEMSFSEAAAGLMIGAGFLLVPAILIRGSIGGGDIKLMGASGFFLGPEWGIQGLFLGLLIAACYGIEGMLSGKRTRKAFIPLGPFLACGLSTVSIVRLCENLMFS